MNSQTPQDLFQEVADLKQHKSDLRVWVSVGGWTFSDNGTATQAVFGRVASTADNRQKFSDNVVTFLTHYGFDGLDIDWEYPGAPDRGGQPEDTANYVLLLKTLRATFDASIRDLGISFTAPSSYWYLRWFDLQGMIKYADWINLMTYDLHGIWDRNNPIGSVVQAHTNLTEIELATELFWRVGIEPSKVVMGFGFYGRTFQLSDSSCSTPGCKFSGGAEAGPCSATSGILMYYEIMALLDQHPGLEPVHDEKAAVKYVAYNNDQWVSYDDADTFKQKVEWANAKGLGGSLIWASDTDDAKYSAYRGLTGRDVGHVDVPTVSKQNIPKKVALFANSGSTAKNLVAQNGQDCKIMPECTDQDNPQASGCDGWTKLGWEKGKCGKSYGHSICCPPDTAPKKCTWRGSGGDCNGQCHVGEATVLHSSWGGFPTESNQHKCSRGYKVFCCDAGDWNTVTDGCRRTGCGGDCDSGEDEVSQRYDSGKCLTLRPVAKYCCPRPALLYDCHWVGSQPDCADAKCASDEVAISLNPQGKGYPSCSWGRKKTNCCKVSEPPPESLQCRISLCDFNLNLCEKADDAAFEPLKRDLTLPTSLAQRGNKRPTPFTIWINLAGSLSEIVRVFTRSYPSRGQLYASRAGARDVLQTYFTNLDATIPRLNNHQSIYRIFRIVCRLLEKLNTRLTLHNRFIEAVSRGRLPSGQPTRTNSISADYLRNVYLAEDTLPAGLPRVASAPNTRPSDLRAPYARVFEAFGSDTNRANFVLTERQINAAKGSLFILDPPLSAMNMARYIEDAADGDEAATERFIQTIRVTISVFRYLQTEEVEVRRQRTRDLIQDQLQLIELYTQGGEGLSRHWEDFYPNFMQQVEDFSQDLVRDWINQARQRFTRDGPVPRNRASVLLTLLNLENQIGDMVIPK